MKAKYIYVALLGLFALLGTGCESRLDIPKHGNMGSQEDFYKTDADAMQALAALYNSWGSNYYNWYFLKNLLADDIWTGGGQRGDNSDMERLNEYTFGTDCSMVASVYSGMYNIIYNANLIIHWLEPDTPVKKQAVAEAKFFRAWANFELVTLYGTAPKVDHLLEPGEYRQANSTPEELWNFVEQDLTDAIDSDVLPSKKNANDGETGIRVTKEVAQAMLGKAYLFQKKYADAVSMFDKVITSKKYSLWQGDYDKLLHVAANGSCESMLEVQKRNDAEQGWNLMTMTFLMSGWRTDKLTLTGEAQATIASGTYGFMNPRKSLYDAFVAMEGKDGYRLNGSIRTYEQVKEFGVTLSGGLPNHEGYFNWKNRALKEDCIYDASFFQALQYINLRVMRYAEVLLLAAEAHVMGGNPQSAADYINEVRTRARLTPLATVTLDDVKKEKRLELWMECVRFQDLVRWGDAEAALGNQGKNAPAFQMDGVEYPYENATYGFKAKHNLLPIPQKEMELNPNMVQNEGW